MKHRAAGPGSGCRCRRSACWCTRPSERKPMSRIREQIVPIVAGALVVVVAVSVVLLLRVANDQGIDALKRAKLAQVQATADSFNERYASQVGAVSGLGKAGWQLTPGSKHDNQTLTAYNVDPNAQSGFYLVNAQGKITSGKLLRSGELGSTFDTPAWPAVKHTLESTALTVLPVTHSCKTTELPCYDLAVAIRGKASSSVRGALVFESAVTQRSPFQQEIKEFGLHAASTAAWFFIDSKGTVVASTQNTGLGKPVEDPRYLTAPTESDIGNRIVFTAEVPSLRWHVVFREDRGQF